MLLRFRHRTLPRQGRPHLMGIVNVTPDSFYDGGATATTDLAVARALAVVSEGATVIDVGINRVDSDHDAAEFTASQFDKVARVSGHQKT